jgi:hypothetical protein
MYDRLIGFPARTMAAAAIAALFCNPAGAFVPAKACDEIGICGSAQAIDDEQMAHVAGKFTIAGTVVGMNLAMTSTWQAANGQRLEGRANLSVALPGSGQAHAQFHAQANVTDPDHSDGLLRGAAATVIPSAGLQSIAGVGQVIQVAGDGNGTLNRAAISVSADSIAADSGNGQLSASRSAANGAEATVHIVDNSVSLSLRMPGAGSAQQQINMAGMGNIQQHIQIAADRQQVMNQMQLQLQIQPYGAAASASQGLSQALNMLRGR